MDACNTAPRPIWLFATLERSRIAGDPSEPAERITRRARMVTTSPGFSSRPLGSAMIPGPAVGLREHTRADGGLDPLVRLRELGLSEIVLADPACSAPLVDLELNGIERRREAQIDVHQRSSADGHSVLDEYRPVGRGTGAVALL